MKTYNIIFAGTPEFALPVLNVLHEMTEIRIQAVITQPDKAVGRQQKILPSAVKRQALTYSLSVMQPASLRTTTIQSQLSALKPDLGIVVAYGKIIPPVVLAIPSHGWVNVHASLLPSYRGASPIQSALLHGDEWTGVTLMLLDAGLDTGPIITQKKIPISPRETGATLHDSLALSGAALIRESLIRYLSGAIRPHPQPATGISITKPIQKENGLIDWHMSAENIDRQIRAYTPWPGAYTFWNNTRLIIKRAHCSQYPHQLAPGMTQQVKNTLLVGTGSGALSIDEVQREGKKGQLVDAFITGAPGIHMARLG